MKVFGPRETRKQWSGKVYDARSLMVCTAHQILFGPANQEE